ncbi:MAG: DUF4349 domain-containing protein [Capsulimonadales bacterium]|nr:DUF4349 domain-containing protein [Capsulimonadales bacterium]
MNERDHRERLSGDSGTDETPECPYGADTKAFLDGELPLWRRWTMRGHLARCEDCRRTMAEMERFGMELKSIGTGEAALSPEMRARLVNGLEGVAPNAADVPDRPKRLPLWRRKPLLVFGGGGATVAASALVFFSLYQPMLKEPAMVRSQRIASTSDFAAAPAAPPVAPPTVPAELAAAAASAPGMPVGESVLSVATERAVHQQASVGVVVASVEEADNKVVALVETAGGYMANNHLSTQAGGERFAELVVKVPVKEFDRVVREISRLGELRDKTISGEDITERISESRSDEAVLTEEIESLDRRLRAAVVRSERDTDLREELRQVRLARARAAARLATLKKLAAMSTIRVSLYEKPKVSVARPEEPGFLADLKETNRAAMAAFQAAIRVPLVMVVWILAFSPLWVPVLLVYRWVERKGRRGDR